MSHVHALGLHKGIFGLQLSSFLMDGKSTWNPTWQVRIMMAGIIGEFFLSRRILNVDHAECVVGPKGQPISGKLTPIVGKVWLTLGNPIARGVLYVLCSHHVWRMSIFKGL